MEQAPQQVRVVAGRLDLKDEQSDRNREDPITERLKAAGVAMRCKC
jgi:hypothetical protein